jgi:uncharacterized protein YceK
MQRSRLVPTILAISLLQGCGTISSKRDGSGWGHPYSGTQCSVQLIDLTWGIPGSAFLPLVVLDIGLSLAADTVLLPVDALNYPPKSTALKRCDRFPP